MKIQFDSLREIKEFILMVDIYHLCDKQEDWGGAGYIITDRCYDPKEKSEIIVTIPEESTVIHGDDYVIVTPYHKQVSWLFKTLFEFVGSHQLEAETLLDGFHVSCEGYFIINP